MVKVFMAFQLGFILTCSVLGTWKCWFHSVTPPPLPWLDIDWLKRFKHLTTRRERGSPSHALFSWRGLVMILQFICYALPALDDIGNQDSVVFPIRAHSSKGAALECPEGFKAKWLTSCWILAMDLSEVSVHLVVIPISILCQSLVLVSSSLFLTLTHPQLSSNWGRMLTNMSEFLGYV